MTDDPQAFVLKTASAFSAPPVLTGVQAQGRLDAVSFELTLRQTYRNNGDRVAEVVYTFPLPATATLLGFASELNGLRRSGQIVGKVQAERQYEAAMEAGDAPVMLETHGGGIHTANIGNLKPGDEIVIEVRIAQLLRFENGRLRLCLPTTIAPRYGNPGASHLQPQQVPEPSVDAQYPLSLQLNIGQEWGRATLECPTHRMATRREADGSTVLSLEKDAWLDRDVVVTVTPAELRSSLLVQAVDPFDADAPHVAMALLQPPAKPLSAQQALAIKLLIDCSPSMAGDSIASARVALRGVLAALAPTDALSLTRFGAQAEQLCGPSAAQPQLLRHLAGVVDGLQADIGGTDIALALRSAFPLQLPSRRPADILLVTDGEIWDVAELVATARQGGQRVFVIGVGASPAENVLRSLADATGGACEFVTPGEALEAAALRMLQRMRQPRLSNARIEWGGATAWSLPPTAAVFGGDTVLAFAGLRDGLDASGVRLVADDAQGRTVELARIDREMHVEGDSLPRQAAAQRLAGMQGPPALALALAYQLMSSQTHAVLVHERAAADKAQEAATLQRVTPMLAAGWGGFGSAVPGMWRSTRASSIPMGGMSLTDEAVLMFLPKRADPPAAFDVSESAEPDASMDAGLRLVAQCGKTNLQFQQSFSALNDSMARDPSLGDFTAAVAALVKHGVTQHEAWILVVYWIQLRAKPDVLQGVSHVLTQAVGALSEEDVAAALQICDQLLGHRLTATSATTG